MRADGLKIRMGTDVIKISFGLRVVVKFAGYQRSRKYIFWLLKDPGLFIGPVV